MFHFLKKSTTHKKNAGKADAAHARTRGFRVMFYGTEALVIAIWLLVFSLIFLRDITTVRWVVFVALVFLAILGFRLVVSVGREIAQRKEIEKLAENLTRANERLLNLDKMKTEFVSVASHQMRSPITAITGYASLILEGSFGPVSSKVRDAVGKILRAGKQMSVSVDDFLNVTRIEQGRMRYNFAVVDLVQLVRATVDDLKLIAWEKGLTVNTTIEEGDCYILADAEKIKQVLSNLIDNAIKYTKEGEIAISLRKEGEKAVVAVKDSGIGIPEKDLPNLFEKFSRASNANTTSVRGAGLGLYIAMQLIAAHKGRIWVETREGEGSTFSFELPLIDPNNPPAAPQA